MIETWKDWCLFYTSHPQGCCRSPGKTPLKTELPVVRKCQVYGWKILNKTRILTTVADKIQLFCSKSILEQMKTGLSALQAYILNVILPKLLSKRIPKHFFKYVQRAKCDSKYFLVLPTTEGRHSIPCLQFLLLLFFSDSYFFLSLHSTFLDIIAVFSQMIWIQAFFPLYSHLKEKQTGSFVENSKRPPNFCFVCFTQEWLVPRARMGSTPLIHSWQVCRTDSSKSRFFPCCLHGKYWSGVMVVHCKSTILSGYINLRGIPRTLYKANGGRKKKNPMYV